MNFFKAQAVPIFLLSLAAAFQIPCNFPKLLHLKNTQRSVAAMATRQYRNWNHFQGLTQCLRPWLFVKETSSHRIMQQRYWHLNTLCGHSCSAAGTILGGRLNAHGVCAHTDTQKPSKKHCLRNSSTTCMRSFHATSRACPGGADFTKHASKGRTGTCQFSKLNKATTKSASRWLQVLLSRMSSMQGMKLWNISQYMMAICGTSTSAALVTQARHRCSGNRLLKSMSGKSRDLCGAFLMVMMTLNSGPYIWLMWLSIHEPYKTVLWQGQTIAVGSSLGRANESRPRVCPNGLMVFMYSVR